MKSVLRSIHDCSSMHALECLSLPFFLDVDALDCRSHLTRLRYDPAHQLLGQAHDWVHLELSLRLHVAPARDLVKLQHFLYHFVQGLRWKACVPQELNTLP